MFERGIFGAQKLTRRILNRLSPGALILMYHRVCEETFDPWSMCVTPLNFADHLYLLHKFCVPIQLREIIEYKAASKFLKKAIAVTFDDGYVDNLLKAKPLLEKNDIPASVFVTSGVIGENKEFWWDVLGRLFLQPGALPQNLEISINNKLYRWTLGTTAYYSKNAYKKYRSWKISEKPPSARQSLYRTLWELMNKLKPLERDKLIEELIIWANSETHCTPTHRTLNANELFNLHKDGLIEIGSHAVTHNSLPLLPMDLQKHEIQYSKTQLEEIIGDHVISFSYPHGKFSNHTVDFVERAGYKCACSVTPGSVNRYANPFKLPRLHVRNWNAQQFSKFLLSWLHN